MIIDLKNCIITLEDGYAGPGGTGTINNPLTAPVTAPTGAPTGGGATGGFLAAGTYICAYTLVDFAGGETTPSNDSGNIVVGATNIPRITFPALPAGAKGRRLYLSTVGGGTGTETLYNTAALITTVTYDLAVAAPGGQPSPPLTNTAGGYNTGATTVVVAGFVGAVANGDLFIIAGEYASPPVQDHTVTAHSETSGNTTSITFTPALVAPVAQAAVITVLPHALRVKIGTGNLTYDERRKVDYVLNRGHLDSTKLGDEEPMDISMDFMWEYLRAASGSTTPTFEEFLKQIGPAANYVSSDSDTCQPYCVNIRITDVPPGTCNVEDYLMKKFRWENLKHDPKASMVAVTGKCNNLLAVVTRYTYSGVGILNPATTLDDLLT